MTGLTQEQFAGRVGVSYETISRWENGKMQPSPLAIKQLERVEREISKSLNVTEQKRGGQELLEQYFSNSREQGN